MKVFFRKILLFLIPLFFSAILFDVFISLNLKKSKSFAHGEYTVWNDILESKVNSDIIINGSSRAYVQINPSIIADSLQTTCYNFGLNGHNFWLENFRFNTFIDKNKKPKIVIQSLDVFTLSKTPDLFNSQQFLPYMLFNHKIYMATRSYNGFKVWDFILPAYRYIGLKKIYETAFNMFLNRPNKTKRIKGYEGQNKKWNNDFDKAKKTMPFVDMPFDDETISLFDQYLYKCKTNNIKLIFVYSPEYIEGQKFAKNRPQIFDLYNSFSKKYNILFYDYSNDSISYQKKYFYNTLHLNKEGATLFTKKLILDLKKDKTFNNCFKIK